MYIWSCPIEIRPYRPNKKKLAPKPLVTILLNMLRGLGSEFYNPITRSIFKMKNAQFFKDLEFAKEIRLEIVFKEEYITFPFVVSDNDQN